MCEGVRAQIQHLKAYVTAEPLTGACVDSRYKYVEKGCALYVEWLGQKENPEGKGWTAGVARFGEVFTIVDEEGDFYKLKAG